MAKGRKKGEAKDLKITDTGTKENGLTVFRGEFKLSKDAKEKTQFTFAAPASLDAAAKDENAKRWYNMMLRGAMADAQRLVRQANDFTLPWKDGKRDAFSFSPKMLAKLMSSAFALYVGKDVPVKYAAIAAEAEKRGILKRSVTVDVEKDADGKEIRTEIVEFAPAK